MYHIYWAFANAKRLFLLKFQDKDFTLAVPISAPVCANGLPGRKKGNQISLVVFVKPGGGNVTWQRTFLLKIFYAQMIKKFAEVIPHLIESCRTAKNVSGNQKKYRKQRTELSLQKVRNLQVIGKIANTGVYNCGRLIFKKQEIAT